MKKRMMFLIALLIVAIIVFISSYFIFTAPKNAGEFSLGDYSYYTEEINFQTDKNYESITDYKSAAKAGKVAISERFEGYDNKIFRWMGCHVRYDKENDAYHIRTYRISIVPMLGGAFDVIMKSDGTVLAIWGED